MESNSKPSPVLIPLDSPIPGRRSSLSGVSNFTPFPARAPSEALSEQIEIGSKNKYLYKLLGSLSRCSHELAGKVTTACCTKGVAFGFLAERIETTWLRVLHDKLGIYTDLIDRYTHPGQSSSSTFGGMKTPAWKVKIFSQGAKERQNRFRVLVLVHWDLWWLFNMCVQQVSRYENTVAALHAHDQARHQLGVSQLIFIVNPFFPRSLRSSSSILHCCVFIVPDTHCQHSTDMDPLALARSATVPKQSQPPKTLELEFR